MKRVILLGVVLLFAGSMAMAADVDINADGTLSGDFTGDNFHIAVTANANVTVDGYLKVDGMAITDTQVGAMGTININAGVTVDIDGAIQIGRGSAGYLNIEGTLNMGAYFCYDGDVGVSYYPDDPFIYAELNISGNGQLNGGLHHVYGGWAGPGGAYLFNVSLSDNAIVNQGPKPLYIGGFGTAGTGNVTMTGSSQLRNDNGVTDAYYDNVLNIGSAAGSGTLTVQTGVTVEFRHIVVAPFGLVEYILDADGVTCVLTTIQPEGMPEGQDSMMRFATGGILDIDITGVAGELLVPCFAVDLATAPTASMIQWNGGDYIASLTVNGSPNEDWHLRLKPGDDTTLQAHIIPEPTTMALLGLGGLLLAIRRRS